jgi:hypothetical protein
LGVVVAVRELGKEFVGLIVRTGWITLDETVRVCEFITPLLKVGAEQEEPIDLE